jgi:hypothetical protein
MYKPYSIFAPPYEVNSGGIRVMYALQSWLEVKGQVALMNTRYDVPFIGVYPEITNGNPLNATHSVRYILQTPGIMSSYGVQSPTTHEYKTNPIYKNDKFYVFSKIYDTFGLDDDHLLFLPVINLHLFRDYGKKRTKTCYLIGKGMNKQQHPKGSIELSRQFSQDQGALADLLNECHTLYGYDHLSAAYDIARLCGCAVQYHGDASKEQLKDYEPGLQGISFGRTPARVDSEAFRNRYEQLRTTFSNKLDIFIEESQSW